MHAHAPRSCTCPFLGTPHTGIGTFCCACGPPAPALSRCGFRRRVQTPKQKHSCGALASRRRRDSDGKTRLAMPHQTGHRGWLPRVRMTSRCPRHASCNCGPCAFHGRELTNGAGSAPKPKGTDGTKPS